MSSQNKKLNEKQSQEQSKKSAKECDYLHPEECADDGKESLDKTRKEVAKEAQEFIEDKNESDEK